MALITKRSEVLEIYAKAAEKKWVIPSIGTENLTTTEAILCAAKQYAEEHNIKRMPVTIAITNQYPSRSQSFFYTQTKQWEIGMKLFLSDVHVLSSHPLFNNLDVMIHLDHIQYDEEILNWDLEMFSSIMFDASVLPFNENIKLTSEFCRKNKDIIVIEGACDEITEAGEEGSDLTTPENALRYIDETGVDLIVANLGTEHRASSSVIQYHSELANEIKSLIGTKMVLHGCSSVDKTKLITIFDDGISKVNIWTILERDSSPVLFSDMVQNPYKSTGKIVVNDLIDKGILGNKLREKEENINLNYFTTYYRQKIIFEEMQKMIFDYFSIWYK